MGATRRSVRVKRLPASGPALQMRMASVPSAPLHAKHVIMDRDNAGSILQPHGARCVLFLPVKQHQARNDLRPGMLKALLLGVGQANVNARRLNNCTGAQGWSSRQDIGYTACMCSMLGPEACCGLVILPAALLLELLLLCFAQASAASCSVLVFLSGCWDCPPALCVSPCRFVP